MANIIKFILIVTCVVMVLTGCSGSGGPSTPDTESDPSDFINPISDRNATESAVNHICLLYNLIYVDATDPDNVNFEIVPVRSGSIHLNILKLLEVGPCTDCFKIVGFNIPEPGLLDVDIEITHPFDDLKFTIFDVRGIMMFNGTHLFPTSGLTMSDTSIGDGGLLNADGYSALCNGNTIDAPVGDFQKYYEGNFATPAIPNSDINGYKYFITDNPFNNRNAFFADSSDVVTFSLKLPTGPFVLGYAVDANWWPPISEPVYYPITDFGPEANCPEGWKIEVTDTPVGDGLTDCGGQAKLTIDVYDWQGKDDAHSPLVECPELFDGEVVAAWKADEVSFTTYEAVVENTNNAPVGTYRCLVSKEAVENDPSKPWLDITAYQLHELEVVVETKMPPTAVAEASQLKAYVEEAISFDASGSHDNDCGNQAIINYEWDWENDGTYDEEGSAAADHSWSTEGIYHVQLRVTDDENQTDTLDEPLEVVISIGNLIWAKRAGGASYDIGYGITMLSDNSTVVTGYFTDWATFGPGELNQTALTSAGVGDIFIARYNPDGTLAWAKSAGGSSYDNGNGITTLSDNSTVVTGTFGYQSGGSATFGPGEPNQTVLTSAGTYDIFIARYNPDGTLAWAKRAGGTSWDYGYGITTLSDNSTVVTGRFEGSATFGPGEPNQTVLTSAGGDDIFIACYNPDGTLAWAKSAGGVSYDKSNGITTLSDNSTVVTGQFEWSATFGPGESNQTVLTSAGGEDIFIACYNPDGTLAWAKRAGGVSGSDIGYGITALSDNSTAVTGYFTDSATFGPGEPNQTVLTSAGGEDIFIACYNPDGTLAWAKSAGGASYYEQAYGITTLSDNSTVVTGYFRESATFGPGEPNQTVLTCDGWTDIFIALYNPDGTLAWAKSAGGNEDNYGYGITTLSDNSTVVTGYFSLSATFGPGEPNQTVLTSAGGDDIFIALFAP